MEDRSALLGIEGIDIGGRLEKMDDAEFAAYITETDAFIDAFPDWERDLKASLEEEEYMAFVDVLTLVCEQLKKIGAERYAERCVSLTNELRSLSHEKIIARTVYLLKTLTTLSVDLQLALEREGKPEDARSGGGQAESDSGEGVQILAVDDTSFFLNTLKTVLSGKYSVTCVKSGRDALKYMLNHTPDLFILDIEMPVMNGFELAERIRESGQQAPIIFLTAGARRENVRKAIEAGAVDFIIKPIDRNQVVSRIGKHV